MKREDELVLAIAAGHPYAEAARMAGVGEKTVRRRMQEEGFRRRVADVRGTMFDEANGKLTRTAVKAAETLEALLDSNHDGVRLAAARSIIEQARFAIETDQLSARLRGLEDRLEEFLQHGTVTTP